MGLYFDKRRNLAMGLAAAGFACGHFIFAPLIRLLIVSYRWQGAMILASGFCLNCCVLGAMLCSVSLWAKDYVTIAVIEDNPVDNVFNLSLLKDIKFIIFLINNILWNIGSLILLVVCIDYANSKGIAKEKGAVLVSTVGFCSLVGCILVALLAGHHKCNRFILFIISTSISGVAIGMYPSSDAFVALLSFSAIYGLFFGAQLGVIAVVTAELFGVERLTSAYGYLMFGNGAGALVGPPLAGMSTFRLINHKMCINTIILPVCTYLLYLITHVLQDGCMILQASMRWHLYWVGQ